MSIVVASIHSQDNIFAEALARSLQTELIKENRPGAAIRRANELADLTALVLGIENPFQIKQSREELRAIDPSKVHFIVSPDSIETLSAAFDSGLAGNILFRKFEQPETDGIAYSRVIAASLNEQTPSLKNLMPNAHVRTIEVKNFGQKEFISDTVFFHLQSLGCSVRVAQTVANAVDELLLNAALGTTNSEPTPLVASNDPISSINDAAVPERKIQMQVASEDKYVGIAVVDREGLLDKTKAFHHLAQAFDKRQVGGSADNLDAGLGLALIMRTGASLRFFCHPGNFTEVSIIFKATQRLLEFRTQFQFVASHVIED